MVIKNIIKDILVQQDKSSKWLAEETGFTEATISKIINGKSYPSIDKVLIIANVLGINPGILFYNEEDIDENIIQVNNIVEKLINNISNNKLYEDLMDTQVNYINCIVKNLTLMIEKYKLIKEDNLFFDDQERMIDSLKEIEFILKNNINKLNSFKEMVGTMKEICEIKKTKNYQIGN